MNEPQIIPMGRREAVLAGLVLMFSLILCNAVFYAGMNLAFALGGLGIFLGSWWYLGGFKARGYRRAAALLWVLLLAAYPRSDDRVLKFCLLPVLVTVPGMLLCQLSGRNRRSPDSALSLLDGPRAFFTFGMGRVGESGRGALEACRTSGPMGRAGLRILAGLGLAIPVLAVLIPLLVFADAAFEGLIDLLPAVNLTEGILTAMFGLPLGWIWYTRGAALAHSPAEERPAKARRGLSALTVNTVLTLVALLYGMYLLSQLAYFVGGFAGILPEGYTLAQYARRGFFEMGLLCAINLGLMALSIHLVSAREAAPLSTKLLCLFLSLVTLFLVAAASAKIFLYIGSFGLTRLRVLTEGFLLWLAVTVVCVAVWLFRPGFSYMKPSLLLGLALCAALLWGDVDTLVAGYNVRAYQRGQLDTVDVSHLSDLSAGAVPWLEELTRAEDPEIARMARHSVERLARRQYDRGLRGWNYAAARAEALLAPYGREPVAALEETELVGGRMELDCVLDGRHYYFSIRYDENYSVLEAGGDARISGWVDTELTGNALELEAAIRSWFEENGGSVTTRAHG